MGGVSPPLPDFFRVTAVDETGSTNDDAIQAARQGEPEGTLMWARRQTKGRGRRGRSWVSPDGNLHLSILLRPTMASNRAGEIAFVTALAAADACATLAPNADIRCKWPNDVLANGRKVGGLLIESSIVADRIDWLVVGIGLNLVAHPDDVEFPATDLALHAGRALAVEEGLGALATAFAERYRLWREDGFTPVRNAWCSRAAGLGAPIRVRLEAQELHGVFTGLDDDGALILSLEGGTTRRITAGDVFFPGKTLAG